MLYRNHRRWLIRLALLAMLFNAWAPTVSWAVAGLRSSAGTSAWTEVCSGAGTRWVQLDDEGRVVAQTTQRPADAPATLHGGACDLCVVHAGSFGLLPGLTSAFTLAPLRAADAPRVAPARPLPSRMAWSSPAVRAPPAMT